MRLIDADALKENMGESPLNWNNSPEEIQETFDWNNFMQLIDEAPTIEADPQWISAKDGLPEKLTPVLVCNHGIYDIAFVGDMGNWVNKLFEPEYWMPLPKPPKEVSE